MKYFLCIVFAAMAAMAVAQQNPLGPVPASPLPQPPAVPAAPQFVPAAPAVPAAPQFLPAQQNLWSVPQFPSFLPFAPPVQHHMIDLSALLKRKAGLDVSQADTCEKAVFDQAQQAVDSVTKQAIGCAFLCLNGLLSQIRQLVNQVDIQGQQCPNYAKHIEPLTTQLKQNLNQNDAAATAYVTRLILPI